MKKERILVMLILSVMLMSVVSAVEIQLTKDTYAPGETLQGEIIGNFLDGIALKNIYLYRERSVPVVYDIFKTEGKYLLYASLPYKEGNYTLKIKDTRYATQSGESTETIEKEFKIETTNTTILSVNPGFVVARDDFFVTLKANENIEVSALFEATGEQKTISLLQNQEKKVDFSIEEIQNYTQSNLKIGNYNIPVLIFPQKSQEEIIKETGSFRFNPLELKATILKNQDFIFTVNLMNLGTINISNIVLSAEKNEDLEILISLSSIPVMESGGEHSVNLTISSDEPGTYQANLTALSRDLSAEMSIEIEITENSSEVIFETPSSSQDLSCTEVGGKVCASGEKCNIPTEFIGSELCCKGTCGINKEPSSNTWVYGIIIILVIAAILGAGYYFMKKKQKINPEDLFKKKEAKFQERMALPRAPPSTEVRKSLSKI